MTAQEAKSVKQAMFVAVLLALGGLAWDSKASKESVQVLTRDTKESVQSLTRDVQDVKYLLCKTYPSDSKCQTRFP